MIVHRWSFCDVVVVWKLDWLSRSLKDLLHIMENIGEAGAGDTTLPPGG
jgi:DNA invertase Pin-like site-specific DNA recombinase